MTIYIAGFVGFLLVLTAEAGVGSSDELSFCTETRECLLFQPVCQNNEKNYEIRRYDSVKWASISFLSIPAFWWSGEITAFWDLKKYLDENKIPMETAPVTVKIPEDLPQQNSFSKMFTKREYTMNFLLPSEHQRNPPRPSNSKVKIVESGDMYVYVRSYSGWVTKDEAEAKLLFSSINMTSYEKPHYAVGYNSPMHPKPYSEVWVVADGVPRC